MARASSQLPGPGAGARHLFHDHLTLPLAHLRRPETDPAVHAHGERRVADFSEGLFRLSYWHQELPRHDDREFLPSGLRLCNWDRGGEGGEGHGRPEEALL